MSAEALTEKYVLALAGQPNTGKSTLFNALTGSRQHVGNWPGKTVEQKIGTSFYKGCRYEISDLPGTYTLSPNSLEEKITRDFLLNEAVDGLIVMVDASQLSRSLYLVTELLPLQIPMVIALNMADVAEAKGIHVDHTKLEKEFGIPVVPMSASKGEGIENVLDLISRTDQRYTHRVPPFSGKLHKLYNSVLSILKEEKIGEYECSWSAVKLVEQDEEVLRNLQSICSTESCNRIEELLKNESEGALMVADARYKWIHTIVEKSVSYDKKSRKCRQTGFDRFATHPVLGKIIALGILFFSFAVAMVIAMPVMVLLQGLIRKGIGVIGAVDGMPHILSSFFMDGLMPALGMGFGMIVFIFAIYLVLHLRQHRHPDLYH